MLERNYLEVYPYDKWGDRHVPEFTEGEEFMPSVCELRDGQTTKPALLTEADLVGLMDKNGIGKAQLKPQGGRSLLPGTDATIAQHIQTIIDREYVMERMEGATKYLVPSTLGIGLVEGYNRIGFDRSLSKPQLRRAVRHNILGGKINLGELTCFYRRNAIWFASVTVRKPRTTCFKRASISTKKSLSKRNENSRWSLRCASSCMVGSRVEIV